MAQRETGWSGSGGGISTFYSEPAFQQNDGFNSGGFRTVPDVAADADPNTGVSVYDPYDFGTTSPFGVVGGTSLAAPLWAGLISIADQGRVLNGLNPLSGPTETIPALYDLPASDFSRHYCRQQLFQCRTRLRPGHRSRLTHREQIGPGSG